MEELGHDVLCMELAPFDQQRDLAAQCTIATLQFFGYADLAAMLEPEPVKTSV